ncbi:MAG: ethylbenzene dehydrogenase-related protein [Candidatus Nitricoxidivorans perseverans]|uniref:Ethylbenzene dehydrogenase-related protein n=1 Tax=Candidatus Nitricoxidivorans perseverans TaxID=2975601 RepID=A0AA49IXV9_9PROT|nr:MAG: ethylbenzene dehydrogenase-related protein [Candidatus Nitricoxidivorans perseverans]
MQKKIIAASLAAAVVTPTFAAEPGNVRWDNVPKSQFTLFYPGQATQEWMKSAAHKAGATGVNEGKNCLACHADEEADIGKTIVSGKKLEPTPIPNKPGSIKLTVQAAYDKEYFYLRASWPTNLKEAGAFHNYKAFKDGKWVTYGSNRTDKEVKSGAAKVSYEDRFNVMLSDNKGGVPHFEAQGCWVTCHNSMRDAPNEPTKEQVEAHPVLGKAGMKKGDIRKYLPETRTAIDDAGGWDKLKDKAALDALMDKGVFLDLWQARAYRSIPVGKADDSHVFQYRNFDKGKKPFDSNWDGEKKQPKFMFDPAKNSGRVALTEAQFRDPKAPKLDNANSVPFDPAKVKEGDVLPGFILNTKTDGSADDLDASGTWANGVWTMTIRRKLNTGQKDDVALAPGQTYPVGLAVHDDNVTTRFHYVSLPLKLSLGKKDGHINAVELK